MSIENGAFLDGHCKRMTDPRGSPAQPGATETPQTPLARITGKDGSAENKKQFG
jgi:hypothetical protein